MAHYKADWLPVPQSIEYKMNNLCYKCITCTAPVLPLWLFNFTLPPVLSTQLLILSASRFLVSDLPLLVPPHSVFGPSTWYDLHLQQRLSMGSFTSNLVSFSKTTDLPYFPFHAAIFLCLKSLLIVHASCVFTEFCIMYITSAYSCVREPVRACVCVCMYALRIVVPVCVHVCLE